jgi:3'-phosphoadenosine 5'-phosphosulfate sulfotransferase (PAPS reductase)/FAD synthetase
MIERVGYKPGAVKYVFFNTGMEYEATIEHIRYLERRYGITIHRERAVVPVPRGCREHGVPFLSKKISQYIMRLQRHGFRWEDRPIDELMMEYPRCKAALRWWCNDWGENSQVNINRRRYLKEFMIQNPPDFKISDSCCDGAKKKTAKRIVKLYKPDLSVQGVRKAEGGARGVAINSCFSEVAGGVDVYRPVFWWKSFDKAEYDNKFQLCHSECYTKYGLGRTGCACCPFGRNFEQELEAARIHEPKLYNLANAVFGKSYEYTREYLKFREEMKLREQQEQETTSRGIVK